MSQNSANLKKAARQKLLILSEEIPVKLSVSFSAEIFQNRSLWDDIKAWTDEMKNSII